MRKGTCAILAFCVAAFATPASADSWNVQTVLIKERLPAGCSDRVITLAFSAEAGFLEVSGAGMDLKLPIAADGTVKQDIRLASGARGSLAGKVATREFEYTSYNTGCRYNWADVK